MAKNKKHALLPVLGLDPSKAAEYIDDRATPNCKNVSIDRHTIQKRLGTVQVGDPLDSETAIGERILAYRELYTSNANNLIRVGLTKVHSMNYGSGLWTSLKSPTGGVDMTASDTNRVDTALPISSGTRFLVFTNAVDAIQKWSGAGGYYSDLSGSPPIAKYIIDYETYLVIANIANYPMRVQWSDTGFPETWSGGNAGSKELSEDGQDITGLSIFGNYLCVHKETAIYLGYLVGTSSVFKFDRKNTGVGTVCFDTIKNLPTGEQAFLARDGIHLFNGISAPLIASPIMEELRQSINPEYIYKCWSTVAEEENEYWVGVPVGSQTEAETIYKYNYATKSCHRDERVNITAANKFSADLQLTWGDQIGSWQQATGRWDDITITKLFKAIIFGDTAGVSSKRTDTPNDISTAIDAFWESKDYQADEIGRMCRWQKMQLWAKGDTVKVEYSIDAGSTWVLIENATLAADYPSGVAPLNLYFDVVSAKIRFKFSNNVLNEQFNLKQFIPWYTEREMT